MAFKKNIFDNRLVNKIFLGIILIVPFFFATQASAAILSPGNISSCGELASAGTYTLTQNIGIVSTSSPCFVVSSPNVVIDGAGFSATTSVGSVAYAVVATNTLIPDGGSAYGTTTIQNITFINFGGGGILANGNNGVTTTGGTGGNVSIINSNLGVINANGGSGIGGGGIGGNVIVSTNSTVGAISSNGGNVTANATGNFNNYFHISNSKAIAAAPNGDLYLITTNGGIYKQAVGTTTFTLYFATSTEWAGIAVAPNGDIYGSIYNGGIYKQTGGVGSFVSVGAATSTWDSMTASPNGDIYVDKTGGDIYKQAGGVGSFVALGETTRNWRGMSASSNGDIYVAVSNGDFIYKRTGGVGIFNAVGFSGNWRGIAAAPNGDVYASYYGADIYMQTGGSGSFVTQSFGGKNYTGIAAAPNGNVYVMDDSWVYMRNGTYAGGNGAAGGSISVSASTVSVSTSTITAIISRGGNGGNKATSGSAGNGGNAGIITLTNATSTGFIYSLPGSAGVATGGASNGTAGSGATTTIATSVTKSITSTGTNGSIVITGTNLDLLNNTYTASSSINLTYSGTITTTNAIGYTPHLIAQTYDLGVVSGAFPSIPLFPGTIGSCGTISYAGTYTLSGNISGVSGSCFTVQVNGVTIDGSANRYTVTATSSNTSYAVVAISTTTNGGSAYGTTTIQNITFTGFGGGGINASGNAGTGSTVGGNGGNVSVINSTLGALTSNGGGSPVTAGSAGNIAVSSNSVVGAVSANGGSISAPSASGNFVYIANTWGKAWSGMAASPNGDIYAITQNGDIYKQTGGTGEFVALNQTGVSWLRIAAAPNGDIYALAGGGAGIYKQTGGVGNFVNISSGWWNGIAITPSGDIYTNVWGGSIYKQTGGVGSFVNLNQPNRNYGWMAAAPNGDVYVTSYGGGGDLFKQTGGTGNFVATGLADANIAWMGVGVATNGNVYLGTFSGYTGDIYMQAGGTGSFARLNQADGNWHGLVGAPNGNVYASGNGGGIYMRSAVSNGGNGGAGGSITISSSTVATTTSQGGNGGNKATSGSAGNGGNAGVVTLTNATSTGLITATPGTAGVGTGGASSGTVGLGATTTIATSTTKSITNTGTNGSIVITGTNLNLSNNTYTASSTFSLTYSGGVTATNATLSAVTSLIANGTNYGAFAGGPIPIFPGNINTCGTLTITGTYTLSGNISNVSGSCFIIQGSGIVIDGSANHYTVTGAGGNSSYAIIATSTTANGGSAYGTTTIQNITFTGFGGGGINASGNNNSSGVGGTGGNIVIATSTMGAVLASGGNGLGGNGGAGGYVSVSGSTVGALTSNGGTGSSSGNGGTINITNTTTGNTSATGVNGSILINGVNPNISNNTYSVSSALNGGMTLTYSGTLNTANTTLSPLAFIISNGTNYGAYAGGEFPIFPGIINTCGNLYFAGTYTLGGPVTGSCNVMLSGIIINGAGNTLTGNVTTNNYGATLSNITVTGAVSSTGANAGTVTINNASNLNGAVSVTGPIAGDGSSSLGSTTISAGGSVIANSVSFVSDVINNGTINSGNTVAGKITNNSTINGNFVFNASSTNSGTVNGNATFNASSTNSGTVTGTARFNTLTAVDNVVSFSGATAFAGTGHVTGNIYDSTGINLITSWTFNGTSSNTGYLRGNAVFNNTSSASVSSTISGNAIFNASSTNLGIINGNADVYYPVVRPLGGTVNGQLTYHGYPGLYFNDTAVGHGVAGKWNDVNNWWTDALFTIHSPVIPSSGDSVIIYGNITNITSGSASVITAIFESTSNNDITITVSSTSTEAALFNASSTNSGTIIGNATFNGPDTDNIGSGTVTGYITRRYNAGVYTVVKDFTHNGLHWLIQAVNGATVNLTGATYSLITNAFQALNNGVFNWANSIGTGAPNLVITTPVSGTNVKWNPSISWGTSNLCQYKIDGGNYTSVNCANNGSDIPRPSAGVSHTIFFKSTDAKADPANDITEKSITFTYDNTQPIDTDCSTPLDEATRSYYYFTANVSNNCVVTASTTLRGDDGLDHSFSLNGNITGNGSNILLQNMNISGLVSSFDNINVSSSTLSGAIDVAGSLTGDTQSTFSNTIVESGATVYRGNFIGNLLNNGTVINSTTTPTTVSGNTTNNGVINGTFIFNATSTNHGLVNGDAILNSNSINNGIVTGNTTLNGSSLNLGTVDGDLTFNTLSSTNGIVNFSGTTVVFLGTGHVLGNIKDYSGNIISAWNFASSTSNAGFTKGNAFFNDLSTNSISGTVSGNAHFSSSSSNIGTITGNADVYYSVATPLTGTVNGTITYHSYPNSVSFRNVSGDNAWSNLLNWFTDTTFTNNLGRLPTTNENVVLFSSSTLSSDVTNNIFVGTSSLTIDGAGHTLTGTINGNGAYGGHDAYDFNLSSIIVTGTTTANGTVNSGGVGGKGGAINVGTSTTVSIVANGADGSTNGGAGGSINVTNVLGSPSQSSLTANGGNSTGCGDGGDSGHITSINSSYGSVTNNAGTGSSATCPAQTHSNGSSFSSVVIGVYTPPTTGSQSASNSNNNSNNASAGGSNSGTLIDISDLLGDLNLKNLPKIGLNVNSVGVSNFVNPLANLTKLNPVNPPIVPNVSLLDAVSNFIASANSLPQSLADISKTVPFIRKELNKAGIINGYDLYAKKDGSPINTPTLTQLKGSSGGQPIGLMFVSVDGIEKQTKLSIDKKGSIYQIINVEPDSYIYASSRSYNKVIKAIFDGKDVEAVRAKNNNFKVSVIAPSINGKYELIIDNTKLVIIVSSVVSPDKVDSSALPNQTENGRVNTESNATPVSTSTLTPIPTPTNLIKKLSPLQRLWLWFSK